MAFIKQLQSNQSINKQNVSLRALNKREILTVVLGCVRSSVRVISSYFSGCSRLKYQLKQKNVAQHVYKYFFSFTHQIYRQKNKCKLKILFSKSLLRDQRAHRKDRDVTTVITCSHANTRPIRVRLLNWSLKSLHYQTIFFLLGWVGRY